MAQLNSKLNPTKSQAKEIALYFANLVLYHIVLINYHSFLHKSGAYKGKVEITDKPWKPLSPKTVSWKEKKKLLYNGKVGINIRYRKLLNALKPGKFLNGRYVPTPYQEVSVTEHSIEFSVNIPYADEVNQQRHIYVVDTNALLEKAVELALPKFQSYLRKLESHAGNPNSRKRKA